MKLLAFLFAAGILAAQPSTPPSVIFVTSDPAGSCSASAQLRFNTSNGKLWGCNALTWSQIGGAGGSGTVSSATVGQIPYYTAATTVGGSYISQSSAGQISGTELISNPNFSGGLTGWTESPAGSSWNVTGGALVHTPGTTHNLNTPVTVPSLFGDYVLKVTVTSISAGSFTVNLGNNCDSDCSFAISTVGDTLIDLVPCDGCDSSIIQLQPTSNCDATISLVSFKIVHGMFDISSATFLSELNIGQGGETDGASGGSFGIGRAAWQSRSGADNLALLDNALQFVTTGIGNIAMGRFSQQFNNTGSYNIAIGPQALRFNVGGSANVAIGEGALNIAVGSDDNTVIGFQGLGGNSGSRNIAIGRSAGQYQTAASDLLIVDNQDRGSSAADLADAIIVGTMAAAPASQKLTFNVGSIGMGSCTVATLPTTNSAQCYCTDCKVTSGSDNTCVGSGGGAMSMRIGGTSKCLQ